MKIEKALMKIGEEVRKSGFEWVIKKDMYGSEVLKCNIGGSEVIISDITNSNNKRFYIRVYYKSINVKDQLDKALRLNNFYNEVSDVKVFVREFIESDMVPVLEVKKSLKKILSDKDYFNSLEKRIIEYENMLKGALSGKEIIELFESYM